jgi:hypothetical protein
MVYRWYRASKLPVPAVRAGHLVLVDLPAPRADRRPGGDGGWVSVERAATAIPGSSQDPEAQSFGPSIEIVLPALAARRSRPHSWPTDGDFWWTVRG